MAVITALESLSIDLYLPAFTHIAHTFHTTIGNVQISLSLFLAGFAIGQLFWGPLSDRYGRKPILLIGLAIFVLSALAVPFVKFIEMLWSLRFLQAFGGCAGIVMSRAIVADAFEKKEAISIFSSQTQISGIAPIIGPLLGSMLLGLWGWHSIFTAISVLAGLCIMAVAFFIPESHTPDSNASKSETPSLTKTTFSNEQFLIYTMVGAMSYSALMIYISSAPYVFMEKAGLSEIHFSLAFGFNSLALIFASYITPKLLAYFKPKALVLWASVALTLSCIAFGIIVLIGSNALLMIAFLFLSLIPIGILLPVTTALGMETVTAGKGTAAAFMGFIQLLVSFALSGLSGILQNSSVIPMTGLRFFAGVLAILFAYWGLSKVKKGSMDAIKNLSYKPVELES